MNQGTFREPRSATSRGEDAVFRAVVIAVASPLVGESVHSKMDCKAGAAGRGEEEEKAAERIENFNDFT